MVQMLHRLLPCLKGLEDSRSFCSLVVLKTAFAILRSLHHESLLYSRSGLCTCNYIDSCPLGGDRQVSTSGEGIMSSPIASLLGAAKEIPMDEMIRVSLHETEEAKGVTPVEINNQATVQNLISSYCAKKGIGYNPKIAIFDGKRNVLSQFRTLQSLGINNGQILYVGYKKKSSIMDRKPIFLLTIVVLAAFVIAIIVMAAVYATSGAPAPFDYGIVMDGGSSKTNVLLYKWAGDKYKGTGCVLQEGSCIQKGGIAKVTNESYVLPCLNEVKGKIKATSVSNTPLYFASTAGMRLLNISDPSEAKRKLDRLSIVLNDTGVSLQTVEIITGKDEGQYAWITANFLRDTLEVEQKMKPWQPTTVGALDMGGASTQISFALEPKNVTDSGVERVELYGQTHDVFSASYLCFGRDEAERRHRALLVTDPNNIARVTDPCSPKDFSYAVTGQQLFDQPCTQSDKYRTWLNQDPDLKNKNVTFVGSGDFDGCTKAMIRLADVKACNDMKFKECFRQIDKPLQNQKFLAFATFYFTTSFLNVIGKPLEEYMDVTKTYCTKTSDEMDKSNSFAASYCFNACYIYEILINGYKFTNSTWPNIEFLGKVDDKEIGWTLGYMIKGTNLIPAKKSKPKFTSVGVFSVCMIIFISVVIAAAVFLAYNFGRKNSGQMHLSRNP